MIVVDRPRSFWQRHQLRGPGPHVAAAPWGDSPHPGARRWSDSLHPPVPVWGESLQPGGLPRAADRIRRRFCQR